MKVLLSSVVLSMSLMLNSAWAQNVTSMQFQDQWDKPVELNAATKWIVVSQNKDSGNLVKDAFAELAVKDLEAAGVVYIADVSKMPSLITKLFALPKMRDYDFKMALIREEGELEKMQLPLTDVDSVAVIQLEQLAVKSNQDFNDLGALTTYLKQNIFK